MGLRQGARRTCHPRDTTTWADFLCSQADALLACDFIETVTLTGRSQYILAVIEHATSTSGSSAHPTAQWVSQTARNLVMDLEDASATVTYPIRDLLPHLRPLGWYRHITLAMLAHAFLAATAHQVREKGSAPVRQPGQSRSQWRRFGDSWQLAVPDPRTFVGAEEDSTH